MSEQPPLLQEIPGQQEIGGASGARLFNFRAYGKGNFGDYPYNVLNEKIASELARIVGLPVPEVLLYRHRDEWLFLSRAIGTAASGESRPPGTSRDVANAVLNQPGLIEEMVCFDLFICNNDRNPGNLLVDAEKRFWLIDFGNALFYRPSGGGKIIPGIPRLQTIEADLEALFDKPYGNFMDSCTAWDGMRRACDRIAGIPSYFIEATIARLPADLLTDAEREYAIDFLNRRKDQMEQLIRREFKRFPRLMIP